MYIAVSLDGFIADKDGSVEWLNDFAGEDYGYDQFIQKVDTLIFGRKTFQHVLEFGEFPYKNKECYVFSRSEFETRGFGETVKEKPGDFVNKLKHSGGKDIWIVGGGEIISQLITDDLIDEYQIFLMPVLLGSGVQLFNNIGTSKKLKIFGSVQYGSGVVGLHITS